MVISVPSETQVWKLLGEIRDPELPALSVVELRIVSSVSITDRAVTIDITPTFVGCPALDTIAESIREKMLANGFDVVNVNRSYTAQWSSDFLDDTARTKLETFGIAPPSPVADVVVELPTLCPYCKSDQTQLESSFGATLCKQLYYCNSCRQSFEKFKSL